jgi:hypothetical protein
MSPQHAKALLALLATQVAKYEKVNGTIRYGTGTVDLTESDQRVEPDGKR